MTTDRNTCIETPLAARHRATGAEMDAWFGCTLPSRWGDPAEEERFAIESVALIDKNFRAYLSLTGPDRVRYLNAILTNNIKDLGLQDGNVSLLLNPQGRILAEIETCARESDLFCVSYAMIRVQLMEWLEKYIIMDDVTLADETEAYGTLALEGPRTTEAVEQLTGVKLAAFVELHQVKAEVGGIKCWLFRRSPVGVAGAEFLAPRQDLVQLWEILQSAVQRLGGGAMGYEALSARRLAQRIPWFGYDFGEQQIPHEAGLENSHISYTKGCYTGQEIVERVRSRGQVTRRRVLLRFAADVVPPAGTLLTADGKEIGHVTRAARSFHPPAILGMAYVRKEQANTGSKIEWAGGSAEVL